jgi:hypothetical protein
MVNIAIHHSPGWRSCRRSRARAVQAQLATYQKLVVADSLSHKAVGKILNDTLNRTFTRPFSVLDIACGDASEMKRALAGTQTRHYHGVDLSEHALELAATSSKPWPAAPSPPIWRGAACPSITSRRMASSA